jgi:hypothetical protein
MREIRVFHIFVLAHLLEQCAAASIHTCSSSDWLEIFHSSGPPPYGSTVRMSERDGIAGHWLRGHPCLGSTCLQPDTKLDHQGDCKQAGVLADVFIEFHGIPDDMPQACASKNKCRWSGERLPAVAASENGGFKPAGRCDPNSCRIATDSCLGVWGSWGACEGVASCGLGHTISTLVPNIPSAWVPGLAKGCLESFSHGVGATLPTKTMRCQMSQGPCTPEIGMLHCSDGLDNDGDNLSDGDDPGCQGLPCQLQTDSCFICGGDNTSCADSACGGLDAPYRLLDSCGICGGDGRSCPTKSAANDTRLLTREESCQDMRTGDARLRGGGDGDDGDSDGSCDTCAEPWIEHNIVTAMVCAAPLHAAVGEYGLIKIRVPASAGLPRPEPHNHHIPEWWYPSEYVARGGYLARDGTFRDCRCATRAKIPACGPRGARRARPLEGESWVDCMCAEGWVGALCEILRVDPYDLAPLGDAEDCEVVLLHATEGEPTRITCQDPCWHNCSGNGICDSARSGSCTCAHPLRHAGARCEVDVSTLLLSMRARSDTRAPTAVNVDGVFLVDDDTTTAQLVAQYAEVMVVVLCVLFLCIVVKMMVASRVHHNARIVILSSIAGMDRAGDEALINQQRNLAMRRSGYGRERLIWDDDRGGGADARWDRSDSEIELDALIIPLGTNAGASAPVVRSDAAPAKAGGWGRRILQRLGGGGGGGGGTTTVRPFVPASVPAFMQQQRWRVDHTGSMIETEAAQSGLGVAGGFGEDPRASFSCTEIGEMDEVTTWADGGCGAAPSAAGDGHSVGGGGSECHTVETGFTSALGKGPEI